MIRHFLSASSFILLSVLTLNAYAADIEIDDTVTSTQNLGAGDNLFITDTGALTTSGNSVVINGVMANSFINEGLVSSANGDAIRTENTGAGVSGSFINRGTISAANGFGWIFALHDGVTTFDNYGTINGRDGIFSYAANSGLITNHASGVIDVTDRAFVACFSSHASPIRNLGIIRGNTGIDMTCGFGDFGGGITNEEGGIIEGTGGTAILANAAYMPTAININGGRIIGDVIDVAPQNGYTRVTIGGDFETEGDFDVSTLTVNGGKRFTIAPDNTVTLYDMPASAGVWAFGIEDSSTFATLTVTNGDIDFRGATVAAHVGAGNLVAGERLLMASGSSTMNGGAGQATQLIGDNSLLWNFLMEDGSHSGGSSSDLYFLVARANTANAIAGTPNNAAVAPQLESLPATGDQATNAVLTNLNMAATEEEVNNVLSATLPILNNGGLQANINAVSATFDVTGDRLHNLRAGMEQGDGLSGTGLRFWGQAVGEQARQEEQGGIAGFQAETYGMALGADTDALLDHLTIGAAISHAQSNVDGGGANKPSLDADTVQLTLYGNYDLNRSAFVNVMGAYAFGSNDTVRESIGGVAGLNAFGSYDSHTYSLRTEGGYDIRQGAVTVTPSLLAFYTHYDAGSYNETGAGGVSLNDIDSASVNQLDIGATARAAYDITMENEAVLQPAIYAGYSYDVIGDDIVTQARFAGGGSDFTVQGAERARGIANAGLALEYNHPSGWDFSGGYGFKTGHDYTAHTGTARASFKF